MSGLHREPFTRPPRTLCGNYMRPAPGESLVTHIGQSSLNLPTKSVVDHWNFIYLITIVRQEGDREYLQHRLRADFKFTPHFKFGLMDTPYLDVMLS